MSSSHLFVYHFIIPGRSVRATFLRRFPAGGSGGKIIGGKQVIFHFFIVKV
jgi:hypothetical protein